VKGYVPGFSYVLGHEFVGQVIKCTSRPDLEGRRVVGEINCNDGQYCCSDLIFQRNHAPGRSVLVGLNLESFKIYLIGLGRHLRSSGAYYHAEHTTCMY
jgi:threonine dehydrogenase-like Zn-dependent dehydrogenase